MFWAEAYLWIKALHVISVIAWMAGMLYLPRLYVYHCSAPAGSERSAMLKTMERRLLKAIVNPAMIATWIFGLILVFAYDIYTQPWFHAKAVLVIALSALHGVYAKWRRDFEQDRNRRSERFYRIWNEVPALLMVGIVLLAVAKPF